MITPLAILKKMFLGGTWFVGIRDYTKCDAQSYMNIEVPKGQWIADPFIVENDGRHYLFCEQYFNEKQKASIGCFEIVDGKAINNHIIIETSYHMSYPCVFSYNGTFYMIPESSANKTIDLYKADNFPYKWSHHKVLHEGDRFVDTTVFIYDGEYYLLSYVKVSKGWDLVVFSLKMDMLTIEEICRYHYNTNIGRPAGFLYKAKKLIRPAQDCHKKYGESIIFYSVEFKQGENYREEKIGELKSDNINFPFKIDRIHTINRDDKYEVIDVFKDEINLFHGLRIIKRAYFTH